MLSDRTVPIVVFYVGFLALLSGAVAVAAIKLSDAGAEMHHDGHRNVPSKVKKFGYAEPAAHIAGREVVLGVTQPV
jgi:hypothetical protein